MVLDQRQIHIRFGQITPSHLSSICANPQTSNQITTAKYGYSTFVPKFFLEQYRRYSNIFFTIIALFQQIPDVSPTGRYTTAVPLLCIFGVSAIKEIYEDLKRHKADAKVNETDIAVLNKLTLKWDILRWQDVKVGDIVRCESENFFPSDMLLLSSSEEGGMCYIETANLDGETNLKIRQAQQITISCITNEKLESVLNYATLECDLPNNKLYEFEGQLSINNESDKFALCPDNILLRGAKLKNTGWIYGLVLYTGHESKLMMNSLSGSSVKRSKLEKITNTHILWLVFILLTISFISSIFSTIWTSQVAHSYIFSKQYEFAYLFLTFVILYNNLVPISLQVSLEVVRTFQAHFINSDLQMYDKESDTYAMARTSNLNEELGEVRYILSDKTGTLTRNIMTFKECSINGKIYDQTSLLEATKQDIPYDYETILKSKASTSKKGPEKPSEYVSEFLTLLASCHTVVPETEKSIRKKSGRHSTFFIDDSDHDELCGELKNSSHDNEKSGAKNIIEISDTDTDDEKCQDIKLRDSPKPSIVYHSASPDEGALVRIAQKIGYEFFNRSPTTISIKKFGSVEKYELLNIFEFDSFRKRMSVVLRGPDGKIKIYSKGADTVIYERTANQDMISVTSEHILKFAHNGLRTLCCAYAEVDSSYYESWLRKYKEAHLMYGDDKLKAIEASIADLEKDLILLGATAIEDKLQEEVPETIDLLLRAGINFWLLTGDKQETAINIGFSSKLLSRNMNLITINEVSFDATREFILSTRSTPESALVIDGKSLHYALTDELKNDFMKMALTCKSVICCRVSPFQKAAIVELVKKLTGQIVLAIGDGANDVAMIKCANIGVGISGTEGLQAVNSSDYAIAKFKFLSRLLLVHGAWSLSRLKKMILYSFYKNIALCIIEFWFAIVSGWSGQTIFERWTIGLYNVIFTAAPPFAIGVFDRRCSAEKMMKVPVLYSKNLKTETYGTRSFWIWIATALWHSLLLFWFSYMIIEKDALWSNGKSDGGYLVFGCILYTYVVVTVCLKAGLVLTSWTILSHFAIWGSISSWFTFLVLYSRMYPTFPIAPDMVGIDYLIYTTWCFWFGLILVPFTTLLFDIVFKVLQTERMTKKLYSLIRKNGLAPFCC